MATIIDVFHVIIVILDINRLGLFALTLANTVIMDAGNVVDAWKGRVMFDKGRDELFVAGCVILVLFVHDLDTLFLRRLYVVTTFAMIHKLSILRTNVKHIVTRRAKLHRVI